MATGLGGLPPCAFGVAVHAGLDIDRLNELSDALRNAEAVGRAQTLQSLSTAMADSLQRPLQSTAPHSLFGPYLGWLWRTWRMFDNRRTWQANVHAPINRTKRDRSSCCGRTGSCAAITAAADLC